MNCHVCNKSNDQTALFCVYCGVRLQAVAPVVPTPATGQTIDLNRQFVPRMTSADPSQPRQHDGWYPRSDTPLSHPTNSNQKDDQRDWVAGGILDWIF